MFTNKMIENWLKNCDLEFEKESENKYIVTYRKNYKEFSIKRDVEVCNVWHLFYNDNEVAYIEEDEYYNIGLKDFIMSYYRWSHSAPTVESFIY